MPLWRGFLNGLGVGQRGNRHLTRLTTEPKRGVFVKDKKNVFALI